MAELMREEVYTAIGRFETRALVQDIVIERDDTTVTLTVYYINRITRRNQFVPIVFQNPVGG
jgi:phage baseplate assembly protein W